MLVRPSGEPKHAEHHKRSLSFFLLIGAGTAAVYFAIFFFLVNIAHSGYIVAVSIAYGAAVLLHFTLNRKITFRKTDGNLVQHIFKYAGMALINYLVTIVVVKIAVAVFAFKPAVGAALGIGATVANGYVLSRYWVFRT